MADFYLRSSDGDDGDDGSTWALAFATFKFAAESMSAGDRLFIDSAHSETQATTMSIAFAGTPSAPCQILSVDDTADPEPATALLAGAFIETTGNSELSLGIGHTYFYGITFKAGTGVVGVGPRLGNSAAGVHQVLEKCLFRVGSSHPNGKIFIGPNSGSSNDDVLVEWIDCQVQFDAAGQDIFLLAQLIWRDTLSAIQGTVPDVLFVPDEGTWANFAEALVSGVDLSALVSEDALVLGSITGNSRFVFNNCKLGADVAVLSGSIPSQSAAEVSLLNCDSGDTNYRMEIYRGAGSVKQETVKVRTGGASDGTTGLSWAMASTAIISLPAPLCTPWITGWIDTAEEKTWTAEILHDSLTDLQDDEVWIEVEFMGTSGFPLSTLSTDRVADVLASAANQATSAETWTTTGLTNPNEQALSVTETVAEIGQWRARVCLALASKTVFVCPKIEIT